MNKREAQQLGRERGYAAATWVFDGNTTDATFARVAQLMADGDPALYDIVRAPAWLSGEYAGESISELLPDLPDDSDRADEYLRVYEESADKAFWREVERVVRVQTRPRPRCAHCGEYWPCTVARSRGAYRADVSAQHVIDRRTH